MYERSGVRRIRQPQWGVRSIRTCRSLYPECNAEVCFLLYRGYPDTRVHIDYIFVNISNYSRIKSKMVKYVYTVSAYDSIKYCHVDQ